MSWINDVVKSREQSDKHKEWVLFKQKRLEQNLPDVMHWFEKNIRKAIELVNTHSNITLHRRKDHVYVFSDERMVCADLDYDHITTISINTTMGSLKEHKYWLKINDDGDLCLHDYDRKPSSFVLLSDIAEDILKFLLL